jgi:diguanylate cyclase (GGDEF)-like protein
MAKRTSPEDILRIHPELALKGIKEIAQLTTQGRSLEDLLPEVTAAAAKSLQAQAAWITLVSKDLTSTQAHYTYQLETLEPGRYPVAGTLEVSLLDSESPQVLQLDPEAGGGPYGSLTHSTLAGVALKAGEQQYGTLKVLYAQPTELEASAQDVLVLLGAVTANAVHNHCLKLEVQQMTDTDPLTGLYNQHHFLELAELELKRSRRYAHPLSLLYIDIDHFRQINEAYGHSVGDQVLGEVARLFKQNLRSVDLLGRYGGEEFTLLLPETGLNDALGVAGRLLYTLRAEPITTSAGKIPVTVSIGVSGQTGKEELSIDHLLDQADRALYQSKKEGRDRVTVWLED